MAKPVSETQSINPGSVIEMFELTTDAALHWSATTYRFHDGSNPIAYGTNNAKGNIVWNGNTYIAVPLEADGFKYANGQLPRPTLTISNVTNLITAILLNVNVVTPGNDLTGAVVTRVRTLARFLDAVNFTGGTNPYGTPDPTAEYAKEIYKIDRKSAENRAVVQFELAAAFDLANIRIPLRVCTKELFPSIGTFMPWMSGKKLLLVMQRLKILKNLVVYC